uniref:(northern house mosquito) hypothetical protein n=1 Tax=Culex pipiens TaxID=7175 RepID=A0A8D8KHG2_CULPI
MEETEPSVTKVDAMLQTENSDQLHLQINEISNKYTFLVKTSEQKDDLIKLLIKEKNILDGEKILVRKNKLKPNISKLYYLVYSFHSNHIYTYYLKCKRETLFVYKLMCPLEMESI